MSHTIRDQYDIITGEQGFQTDFQAMLDWLSYWNMKPCNSEYFGEEMNSILVNHWIEFRNSLKNTQQFARNYLEQCARDECEPDDLAEFDDNLASTSDGHLMALGRLFYSEPVSVENTDANDTISIEWSIEDVQHICSKVTDQQARDVLHFMKTNHNAEIGINWDVIDSAIDAVLPEIAESADDTERHLDEKYANDIIDGRPQLYDAIEIHGVRNIHAPDDPDDPDGTCYEVDDENPELFSVYLHIVSGGVDCVGDFSTRDFAVAYAEELSRQYLWEIHNFCEAVEAGVEETNADIIRQLQGHHPNHFFLVNWDFMHELIAGDISCSGKIACVVGDYSGIEEAAIDGAVYFASQPITNRYELEGVLLGSEVTQTTTGIKASLYFVKQ